MKDKFGREIDYLRVSVTDSCNLRCIYCMEEKNNIFLKKKVRVELELKLRVGVLRKRMGVDSYCLQTIRNGQQNQSRAHNLPDKMGQN